MTPKKMGRPPSQNPKAEQIAVRLDKETSRILYAYMKKYGTERAEAVRRGIKKLEVDLKN